MTSSLFQQSKSDWKSSTLIEYQISFKNADSWLSNEKRQFGFPLRISKNKTKLNSELI